jgi:23S rRNA pseudouridine2605 synthase
VRLAKYLAHAGIASRRAAEKIIDDGRVMVNGLTVLDPATDVTEQDDIRVDERPAHLERRRVVIALNKPVGYVSTASDPQGRPTVVSLVPSEERLYPVGRLDADSSGLILLTNDGALAHKLLHPSFEVPRTYLAIVRRPPVKEQALRRLREGVELEDGRTAPALARRVAPERIELIIREGRKRQVRRMCDAVGHPVDQLTRVAFGPLRLGDLPPGGHRRLTRAELELLRKATERSSPRGPGAKASAPAPAPASAPAGRGQGGRPSGGRGRPSAGGRPSGGGRGRPSAGGRPAGGAGDRPSEAGVRSPGGAGGRSSGTGGRPAEGGGRRASETRGRPSGPGARASAAGGRASGDGGRPAGGGGRASSGRGRASEGAGRPFGGGGRPSEGGGRPSGDGRPSGGGGRPSGDGRPPGGGGRPSGGGGRPSGGGGRTSGGASRPSGGGGRPSGGGGRPSGGGGRPSGGGARPSGGPGGRPSGGGDRPAGGGGGRPSGGGGGRGGGGRPRTPRSAR